MSKLFMIVCVALLIATCLPGVAGVAATVEQQVPLQTRSIQPVDMQPAPQTGGGTNWSKEIIDQMWVNVQNAAGAPMNKAELDKMIQYWKARGWVPVYPIYREHITGILSLLFVKYGIYSNGVFMGVLLAGTYWDNAGRCIRVSATGAPVKGQNCRKRANASRPAGLASLRAVDLGQMTAVTEASGSTKSCWSGYVTSSRKYAHGVGGYIIGVGLVKGSIPVIGLRSPWPYPVGKCVTVCGKFII